MSGRLPLGRSRNCRDVGGHPTKDGVLRRGVLFRSDLPLVDEENAHDLASLGLRTVVDLREPDERRAHPAVLGAAALRVLPMASGLGPIVAADPSKAASLAALYRTAVLETGAVVAAVVSELAQPGALPALVHCAAGKDRTGIVIAILLSALGVSDEDVARDYAQSAVNLGDDFFEALERTSSPDVAVDLTALRSAESEDVLLMLALVRETADSARSYLLANGVTDAELDGLARELVDPHPASRARASHEAGRV